MQYYVNFNTGVGDETVNGTLEDAMKIADEGVAYTQEDIEIYEVGSHQDENGQYRLNLVAIRHWWGVEYDPEETEDDESEVICFGTFGHYGSWNVL